MSKLTDPRATLVPHLRQMQESIKFPTTLPLTSDAGISSGAGTKLRSNPGLVGRKNGAACGAFGGSLGLFRC